MSRMKITPDLIYQRYLQKDLSKSEVLELLISIMDNINNEKIRSDCLNILGLTKIVNQKVFRILENNLISDESPLVRRIATRVLFRNYPKKDTFLPFKWVILHERSPLVLRYLLDLIENSDDPHYTSFSRELRLRLFKIYNVIPEAIDLILNLEAYYVDYSEDFSFEIGTEWFKIIRLLKCFSNSDEIIPKITYLRKGGTELTYFQESLELLKSNFPKSQESKSLPNFWKRIKLELIKTT